MSHPLKEDIDLDFQGEFGITPTYKRTTSIFVRPAADKVDGTVCEGTVKLDHDDVYVGQIQEVTIPNMGKYFVPHGYGTLTSESGGHKFRGEFENRMRQGTGVLETSTFLLHSSWNNNRPATSRARMDYLGSGDRYMGHLMMETKTYTIVATKSKFTQWLKSTDFLRDLWGEMIYGNGDAFFGQWHRNDRHGFGVHVYADGGRFVGSWVKNQRHGHGCMLYPNGVIYEGEWRRDEREGGALLCPSGLDLRATWRTPDGGVNFKAVVCGEQRTMASLAISHTLVKTPLKRVAGCAVPNTWQSLLFLHRTDIDKEKQRAGLMYQKIASELKGNEAVRAFLRTYLQETVSPQARHPLAAAAAIFKRIFYFLYGSCGTCRDLGSGTKSVKARNNLSWCSLKKHSGGCYHATRGPIQSYHIHCAVDDVLSFVEESLGIVKELLGPAMCKLIEDLTLTHFLSTTYLDIILPEVSAPLFNLYHQVYREKENELQRTYKRLGSVTLDDLGVGYARNNMEESLFTPYADPITRLESLGSCTTLTSLCRAVSEWSGEIDKTSRAYQITVSSVQDFARVTEAFGTSGSFASAVKVDPAGADDLFPIHLYTFLAARVPHVLAITEFISDMSVEENYYDPHGAHNFCLAMLTACISHAEELYKDLRERNVMVPTSLFHARLRSALFSEGTKADYDWVVVILNGIAAAPSGAMSVQTEVLWRSVNPQGTAVLRALNIELFRPSSDDPRHNDEDSIDRSLSSPFEDSSPVDVTAAVTVIPSPRYPNFLYSVCADQFYMTIHQNDDR